MADTSIISGDKVIDVKLDDLFLDSADRTKDDLEDVRALAASMKTQGQIVPIDVTSGDNGKFKVIDGKRRVNAARLNKWDSLKAVEVKPKEADETTMVSANLFSKKPNEVQEAKLYRKLLDDKRYKNAAELARAMGVSQAYMTERLKLLQVPEDIQKDVEEGKLSARQVASAVKGGKKKKKIPTKEEIKKQVQAKRAKRLPNETLTPSGQKDAEPLDTIHVSVTKDTVSAKFTLPFSVVKKDGLLKSITNEIKKVTDKQLSEGIKRLHSTSF